MFNYKLVVFYFLLFIFQSSFADDVTLVSKSMVNDKIKAIENIKDLVEEDRKSLLDLYAKILEQVDLIKSYKKQRIKYIDSRKLSPDKIKKLETILEKIENNQKSEKKLKKKTQIKSNVDLELLMQQLDTESANLAAVGAINAEISQKLRNETTNTPNIRKRLIDAYSTIEELLDEKKLESSYNLNVQKQAAQWFSDALIIALRTEIKMINEQLLSQPVRVRLLEIEKQISDFKLNKIRATVIFFEQDIAKKRELEIKKTQEKTRLEQNKAQHKHAIILSFAKLNTELSDYITFTNKKLTDFEAADDIINLKTKELFESLSNTKKKLEIAGLNEILGQVLLKQKYKLPNIKLYAKNLKNRGKLLTSSGLKNLEFQEEFSRIKKINGYLSFIMKDIKPIPKTEKESSLIKKDLRDLIKTRKELLIKVMVLDDHYLKAIGDLDFAEKKLIIVADKYMQLLDKYLLWLANAPILNLGHFIDLPGQLVSFFSTNNFTGFRQDIYQILTSSFSLMFGIGLFIFLLFQKHRIIELLVKTGVKTKKISKDTLMHTFKAIFYTLLLAFPSVLLIALISLQLTKIPEISDLSFAIATALKSIILPLFFLKTFRYMCLPGGLFEVHFKWPVEITSNLSKEMRRLMFTLIPIIFFTVVLFARGESAGNLNLGRFSLLLTLFTFALFFYRLLKPQTGYMHSIGENRGLFSGYQGGWFYLSQAVVTSLIVLTIVGYVYTAGQLTKSLIETVIFIFILILIQQVLLRWLLINRRRYALTLAYEKRKARQEVENHEVTDTESREHVIDMAEPEIDIISISEESTKLVNMLLIMIGIAGLIAIWSSILPAFGIFDSVEIWYHTGVINGTEKLLPTTLGDVGLAIMISIVTLVSAKRLPAIMGIILIQGTRINSGNRYTITTLINYSIIGIGFFTVFNLLGAEWAKFQWLFAALSVGIGFGLQEIVANFISGLIILFERPIRVGDYISVGENEGVVSRIQIRATTILTRDRKELLVPNKEFITGQLLNWSLSDPTTRLIIPVGVAYGSNVPKAKEILLQCANDNDLVLDEPPPKVVFYNFGDNTLDLQLRCFISDVDYRLNAISDINEEINRHFDAAGICIAFPQRDVHLDINQPIDVRLHKDSA